MEKMAKTKKEQLKRIMKRAWEIKRQHSKNIFSICLKMAWREEKERMMNMNEIIVPNNQGTMSKYTFEVEGVRVNITKVEIQLYDGNWREMRTSNRKGLAGTFKNGRYTAFDRNEFQEDLKKILEERNKIKNGGN